MGNTACHPTPTTEDEQRAEREKLFLSSRTEWTSKHMDAFISWIIECSPEPVLRVKPNTRTLPSWMVRGNNLIQGLPGNGWIFSFMMANLSVTSKAMYDQFCRYRIPIYERLSTIECNTEGMFLTFAFAHIYTIVNPGERAMVAPGGNVIRPMRMSRHKRSYVTCFTQRSVCEWKLQGTLQLKMYKEGDRVSPIKAMMGDVFDHGTDDEDEMRGI